MKLARFFRGPYDGKSLVLPSEEPWPRFVFAEFEPITLEVFYLYAGEFRDFWCYLHDEIVTVTDE